MRVGKLLKGQLYYGWYIALALAITETISWGVIYYAFSVFITPMEGELGWSRGELTGGFSLMLLITGVMAFPVGAWIDRHGARWLMACGSILASLLVIGWSSVTDLTSFYFIWAGLGVCGAAVLYEPAFTVIAAWFVRRRGTALAVVTFAAGLASTIFVPLSDALLNTFGWREAIFILGVFMGVTTIPLHAFVLRRRPQDLGLLPDGDGHNSKNNVALPNALLSEALRSRYFWLLTLAFSLSYLSGSAIRVHFIPFLIDIGINPSTAAVASGSIGLMQVVGRVMFAPLDARVSSRAMASGVLMLQALATGVLLLGSSMVVVVLFIVGFGIAIGTSTLVRPSILAELFGSTNYGRISSVMAIFLTLAGTIAPWSAGLIYDHFNNYTPMLWIISFLAIISTLVMVIAKPDTNTPTSLTSG